MRLMDERRTYRDAINEAIDGYIEETEVSLQSQQLYQQQTFFIEVDRSSSTLIEDLIELYRSVPNGFLHAPLKISFLGEAGVDNGALTREFFHLVFDSIIAGGVASGSGGGSRRGAFEGRSGHLLPAVDHLLTEQRVFWLVGVLSAQAVHNGCRGLPGLCAATRRFLGAAGARVGAVPELERLIDAEDVADLELRSLIVKVSAWRLERKPFDSRCSFNNEAERMRKVVGYPEIAVLRKGKDFGRKLVRGQKNLFELIIMQPCSCAATAANRRHNKFRNTTVSDKLVLWWMT